MDYKEYYKKLKTDFLDMKKGVVASRQKIFEKAEEIHKQKEASGKTKKEAANESCFHSKDLDNCHDCVSCERSNACCDCFCVNNSLDCHRCFGCDECVSCEECYNCNDCDACGNCYECDRCVNSDKCSFCEDCFFCYGIVGSPNNRKRYYWLNKPLTKEEYTIKLKEFNSLGLFVHRHMLEDDGDYSA